MTGLRNAWWEESAFAEATADKTKKRQTHRYNRIPLLRFRPGGVLQELVARRRRKGTIFTAEF